jgi:hypothetical protein
MNRFGEDNLDPGTQLAGTDLDTSFSIHLSDEQFTELLLGAASPAIAAHLKVCAHCSEEADRVSAAIGSFERESRLWAEREAASHPRLAPPKRAFAGLRHFPNWAVAAVAVALVVAVGFGSGLLRRPAKVLVEVATIQPATTTPVTRPTASPSTLEADNALLAAIDGELHGDDALNSSVYGLSLSERPSRGKPARRVSN